MKWVLNEDGQRVEGVELHCKKCDIHWFQPADKEWCCEMCSEDWHIEDTGEVSRGGRRGMAPEQQEYSGCFHDWVESPPNQHKLHKCLNCGSIGVVSVLTKGIVPYKCMKPGCIMWATKRSDDGTRYCSVHAAEKEKEHGVNTEICPRCGFDECIDVANRDPRKPKPAKWWCPVCEEDNQDYE